MRLITRILLILAVTAIVLFILLSIVAIYKSIVKSNYNKLVSKENMMLIIIVLFVTSIFSSCSFINSALDDKFKDRILIETSPNGRIDLEIESGTFDFGQGIIIYGKNNDMQNSKLEKLVQYNIAQDMASIGRHNIDLKWDNDTAKLEITGETEIFSIKIWLDEESNKFKYEM